MYATDLIRQQKSSAALDLFVRYGAPAKQQNLNLYRHLATEILMDEKGGDLKSWIGMRNIFRQLVHEYLRIIYIQFTNNKTIKK